MMTRNPFMSAWLSWANRASGIAIGKLGTATVTLAELQAGLARL